MPGLPQLLCASSLLQSHVAHSLCCAAALVFCSEACSLHALYSSSHRQLSQSSLSKVNHPFCHAVIKDFFNVHDSEEKVLLSPQVITG